MKFIVTKTSGGRYEDNRPPWDGAQSEEILFRGEVSSGHCVEYKEHSWVIDINTLDELMKFVDNSDDEVIIKHTDAVGFEYELEIYDDYRE